MNTFSPLSVNRGAVLIRMSVLFFVVFCFSTSHAKVNKDYSDGVLLYCECNESDNGYIFGLAVTKRVTVPYVEFSLDKDFSRIKYAYQLNAKEDKYYEVEIPSSDIENNTYYWRVADKDKRMIPGDKNGMVTFGTKSVEDYSIKTDPSVYGKMDFGDESELEIESIWLRSELNGNRLEWANAPYCSTKLFPEINSSEYANNHGLVVRGNTIYIARGTFNVSAWNYDKEQVWLDRYDLTTGETLPMLRIRLDSGEDFPDNDLMTMIDEDKDGTVYFTSSIVKTSGTTIRLYTVDLANIATADGYEVAYAHFERDFTIPVKPEFMRFLKVSGSIRGNSYTLWGAPGELATEQEFDKVNIPIYRWKVENNIVTLKKSSLTQVDYLKLDEVLNRFTATSPKLLPISEDLFYFHSALRYHYSILYPTLYKFVPDGDCELVSSMAELDGSLRNTYAHVPLGMSIAMIGETPVFAYGRKSGTEVSSMQLLELKSGDYLFKNSKPLWHLNQSGFAKLNIQGCDLKYLPDAPDSKSGNLVAYMPNGGMGLYRLTEKGTTVGIEKNHNPIEVRLESCSIIFSDECRNVRVVDLSGRVCMSLAKASMIDLSSLSKGTYFIISQNLAKPHKIFIN